MRIPWLIDYYKKKLVSGSSIQKKQETSTDTIDQEEEDT